MSNTERKDERAGRPGGMTRRDVLVSGGALAGALALGSATGASAARRTFHTSRASTTITWGTVVDPTFLIPFDANSGATWQATGFVYESVLRWDRT